MGCARGLACAPLSGVFMEAAHPPEPALPPLSPHCSTLSTCCHAMVAAIYPFTWQHTYIPVLPPAMIDIVCSPTPFLIGLLTSSLPLLRELPLEEVSSQWAQGRGKGLPVDLAAGRVREQPDPTALSVSQHPPPSQLQQNLLTADSVSPLNEPAAVYTH